ncbi:MAG TPA: cytochrome c3 family protein [Thermoanaerobaculia bacterium]|nr:cytochrome c3 family protein [Thermoanaerobaculia bacterium]
MKKTLSALGLLIVLSAVTLAVGAGVKAPDKVVIDAAQAKRSVVTFPHAEHVKNAPDCTTCHHTAKGLTATSGQEVASCASCHLDPEKAETPSIREMSLKKNPYHMVCIDCHKEETKGPTKCDDCHPKG